MDDIIQQAESLGKSIAQSDAYQTLSDRRKQVAEEKELQEAMDRLNEASEAIAQKEQAGKPVEPKEKHEVRELQQKVTGNPKMQELARAEADFAALMNRVNRAIREQLR
ncbi:MAG: YlbF family regulator [Planctomycetota bacterium]